MLLIRVPSTKRHGVRQVHSEEHLIDFPVYRVITSKFLGISVEHKEFASGTY